MNRGNEPIHPVVKAPAADSTSAVAVVGTSAVELEVLAPASSAVFSFAFCALFPGIQQVGSIRVRDELSMKVFDFRDVLEVVVRNPRHEAALKEKG